MTPASIAVTWYVERAGGMTAFGLLTFSVLLGIALAGRKQIERWPRFALEDVHRFAGLLAGVFIAVHVGALLVDGYLPFSPLQLILPGLAPYRPLAVALGVVAAELLVALAVTNRLRHRLAHRAWRRAHYLNFAVWVLALGHGLASGSDTRTTWGLSFYALATAVFAGLLVWRVLRTREITPWALLIWPGAAAVAAAELVVAVAMGPLRGPGG